MQTMKQHKDTPPIGIGSYAYRYAIGFQNFTPQTPMTIFDFLSDTQRLGLDRVQLCENLSYADFPASTLCEVKAMADELGLSIEVGMRDLTQENLDKHLEIADLLSSRFLRVVLGENRAYKDDNPHALTQRTISVLEGALNDLRRSGTVVGIENHFDVATEYLVKIAETIADEHIGLIFDTTNCLGFIIRPEEALKMIGPYLVSVHVKDYVVHKVEAGYLIRGAILGEGWLPLEDILRSVLSYNPAVSLILEMTIRREPEQGIEEVIAWEKQAIQHSVKVLRDRLQHIAISQDKEQAS